MLLKNAKVYDNGKFSEGIILINSKIIESIYFKPDQNTINILKNKNEDGIEINCEKRLILPGVIDIHSHLRDMGQKEKETFRSGTKAAAFSGITTVFNMPNTIPPATTSNQVKKWMDKAEDNIYVDVAFIAGIPEGINEKEIRKIIQLGIIGFKIYPLDPLSGINWIDPINIKKLLLTSSKFQVPIFIHSDWPFKKRLNEKEVYMRKGNSLLKVHNDLHPNKNEVKFIRYVLGNCYKLIKEDNISPKKYPKIHFCHISCKESHEEIKSFINQFPEYKSIVSFEVTPHHFLLNYKIKLEFPSYGKVLPPLRGASHSDYLFNQLKQGEINFIGTDHAPHTLQEKSLPFFEAPSGFPGFETYTLMMLDKALRDPSLSKNFIQAATINPARRFNLKLKGLIKEKYYADLIIIEKSENYSINSQKFRSKAKFTPFENSDVSSQLISNKIWKVFLRGREITAEKASPSGRIIRI